MIELEVVESERKGGIEGDTQASVLGNKMVSFTPIKNTRGAAEFREKTLRCLWDIPEEMMLVSTRETEQVEDPKLDPQLTDGN